jgi:hypothetical protein
MNAGKMVADNPPAPSCDEMRDRYLSVLEICREFVSCRGERFVAITIGFPKARVTYERLLISMGDLSVLACQVHYQQLS